MPAGLYIIENTMTSKIYVGCSTQLPRRWSQHKRELNKGDHINSYLQRDYEEYGSSAFKFVVLREYPNDTPLALLEREETKMILENKKKKIPMYNVVVKISSLGPGE